MPDLSPYDPIIADASKAWNVDPNLIRAVMSQESSGRAGAVSPKGAQGLMQIMPQTGAKLGATDLNDPVQNIYAGAKYLSQGLDTEGTPEGALLYYHGGPDWRSSYGPESADYVPGVTAKYAAISKQYPGAAAGKSTPAGAPSMAATSPTTPSDPDEAAGQALISSLASGGVPGSSKPSLHEDPDTVAGAALVQRLAPPASFAMVAPHPAPDGSGSMTNLSDADFAKFKSGQQPTSTQTPGIGENLVAGIKHGMGTVTDTLTRGEAAVDRAVPMLGRLDAAFGQNPQALADAQPAAEAAYQAKYGNSTAASVGNVLGQAVNTAPLLFAGGAGLGALGGAAAEGVGGAATGLGRGLQAGTDLLTGAAAAPGAGVFNNLAARTAGLGLGGAAMGAGGAALTGDDPVRGAEMGAIAGPLAGAAGAVGRGVYAGGKAIGGGIANAANAITGRVSGQTGAIDADLEAATQRAMARNPLAAQSTLGPSNPLAAPTPTVSTNPLAAPPATVPQALGAGGSANPSGWQWNPSLGNGGYGTAPTAASPANALTSGTSGRIEPRLTPQSAPLPQAQSVGAAVSPATAPAMSAAQAEASRATGFNQRMSTQAAPGLDNTEYVPGSKPTLPEQLADPALAAQQRVIAPGNPEFAALDRSNNEARLDHFDGLAGTPTTLQNLEEARDAQAQVDLSKAFTNKQPADAQPVLDHLDAALAGPNGKLGPVRSALTEVRSSLFDADGNLESDPEVLYGARKNISYLLSKAGRAANPGYADATVQRQLAGVKDVLDSSIESGAPGYQQYLSNYAQASKPIDVQDLLQSYRTGLLDASGNMQLSRVNAMMKSIGQKMQAQGVNPAKSLDDNTVDQLFNLRSDLLRQNNRNLARPAGSDTAHNLTVGNEIGMNALSAGAHVLASRIPGAGMIIGPAIQNAVRSSNAKVSAHLTNKLLEGLPLQPPQGGYAINPLRSGP